MDNTKSDGHVPQQGVVQGLPIGPGNPPAAYVFKPGHSGNPKGRPKGPTITSLRQKWSSKKAATFPWTTKLAQRLGVDPDRIKIADLRALMAVRNEMEGNAGIYRENLNRDEGPIDSNVNITAQQADPVESYVAAMRATMRSAVIVATPVAELPAPLPEPAPMPPASPQSDAGPILDSQPAPRQTAPPVGAQRSG